MNHTPVSPPNLSARPHRLTVERIVSMSPDAVFRAWTQQLDAWLATPGTLLMKAEVNRPFFFEVDRAGVRLPHYGRFLAIERYVLLRFTWVTGSAGTKGTETVVTIELMPARGGTEIRLTHSGFADEESRDAHEAAWPRVLDDLEQRMNAHSRTVESARYA
jgi:uncharacterized protein YndB with AHSA1/START domain